MPTQLRFSWIFVYYTVNCQIMSIHAHTHTRAFTRVRVSTNICTIHLQIHARGMLNVEASLGIYPYCCRICIHLCHSSSHHQRFSSTQLSIFLLLKCILTYLIQKTQFEINESNCTGT